MGIFTRKSKAAPVREAKPAAAPTASPTATHDTTSLTGDYTIDPSHTRLGFSARHAMVTTVRGVFEQFDGSAHIDAETPSSSWVKLSIKTASITTGQPDRDGHLTSADFFDADANPEITFTSTHVDRHGDDWTITGDMSLKGVAKPVTIKFEYGGAAKDPFGNVRVGFAGSTTINRKDWGLTWNAALETGGVLVSEKISLDLDISAIRAS